YFYPVPNAARGVRLWTRVLLSAVNLTDTFSLPPGYQNAITLSLAEAIAAPYEKPVPPDLARRALEARLRVLGNNPDGPRLATRDSGLPSSGGQGAPTGKTYLTRWM